MLQLRNETPFQGLLFAMPDPNGIESLFTVVKGTFVLQEPPIPADEQVPVSPQDRYHGDPLTSSIAEPSDVCGTKPGTDVLLAGGAYGPGGRAVTESEVTLAVGTVKKAVRVYGDRVWESGVLGTRLSPPKPFTRMPLVWERAFGGTDRTEGTPPQVYGEERNPVGRGFRHKSGVRPLDGLAAPNLEDPAAPIKSWRDRPPPACFAPLAPHWLPRRSYAGTYDAAWQERRAPYLPADFDARFFQLAPPGLVAPGYLEGGEALEVRGATPSGSVRCRLPKDRIEVTFRLEHARESRPANLDTLTVEPDAGRIVCVWRAGFPCDKKLLRVREVSVAWRRG
jgi:hypothetical protein